jgi:hypothetical protein
MLDDLTRAEAIIKASGFHEGHANCENDGTNPEENGDRIQISERPCGRGEARECRGRAPPRGRGKWTGIQGNPHGLSATFGCFVGSPRNASREKAIPRMM